MMFETKNIAQSWNDCFAQISQTLSHDLKELEMGIRQLKLRCVVLPIKLEQPL